MARPEGGKGGSLDDAIDELQKLVKLSEASNELQRATQAILSGHAPIPGGRGGGGPGGDSGGGGGESPAGFFRGKWHGFKKRLGKIRYGAYRDARMFGASRKSAVGIGKAAGRIAVVAGIAQAFNDARKAVGKWTDEVFASAQKLSQFSGSMAAVMAQREVQQIQRDIRRGEATSGSADKLQQAESRRKEEELKISIAVDNLRNTVLTVANNVIAAALKPLASIAERVNQLAEKYLDWGAADPKGLGALMDTAAAEDAKIVAAGNKMMELAKAGAKAAAAPAGAAPAGALPLP